MYIFASKHPSRKINKLIKMNKREFLNDELQIDLRIDY